MYDIFIFFKTVIPFDNRQYICFIHLPLGLVYPVCNIYKNLESTHSNNILWARWGGCFERKWGFFLFFFIFFVYKFIKISIFFSQICFSSWCSSVFLQSPWSLKLQYYLVPGKTIVGWKCCSLRPTTTSISFCNHPRCHAEEEKM